MSAPADDARRVLLVLGHSVPHDDALHAAVAVAARLSAQLHALFIEDEDVLRAAALPVAVRLLGARAAAQTLREAGVLDQWRALSERARLTIQREAVRCRVPLEYQVARGPRASTLAQTTGLFDLVLFLGERSSAARSLASPVRPSPEVVKVLYDGGEAAERALEIGRALANASHPLEVWSSGLGEADKQRLRLRLGARVTLRDLPEMELSRESVLRLLFSVGAGVVIVPEQAPLATWVGTLSREVGLPCVVVLTR